MDASRLLTGEYRRIEQLLALASHEFATTDKEAARLLAEIEAFLDADEEVLHRATERALGRLVHFQRTLHARVRISSRHLRGPDLDVQARARRFRSLREVFGRYSRFAQDFVIPRLTGALTEERRHALVRHLRSFRVTRLTVRMAARAGSLLEMDG